MTMTNTADNKRSNKFCSLLLISLTLAASGVLANEDKVAESNTENQGRWGCAVEHAKSGAGSENTKWGFEIAGLQALNAARKAKKECIDAIPLTEAEAEHLETAKSFTERAKHFYNNRRGNE